MRKHIHKCDKKCNLKIINVYTYTQYIHTYIHVHTDVHKCTYVCMYMYIIYRQYRYEKQRSQQTALWCKVSTCMYCPRNLSLRKLFKTVHRHMLPILVIVYMVNRLHLHNILMKYTCSVFYLDQVGFN
jgi:hypothetical protein